MIFADDDDRERFTARLAGLASKSATDVLAWALLPNHFHLLLRTAAIPLSDLMRRLNTGYAIGFNRRHRRSGYVFQNRFKSILVEEDPYLLELVRYIHLNPIRAGLVPNVQQLEAYRWTGHGALVGSLPCPWQATAPVLALFGCQRRQAREAYRRFIAAGVASAPRLDLRGGGLRRSRRGWLICVGNVRGRDRWAFDERVLGSSEFVQRVLADAGNGAGRVRSRDPAMISAVVHKAATVSGTSPEAIASASHQPAAVAGRALVSCVAVLHLGLSANAVAEVLGVTRSSVRRGLSRSARVFAALGCTPAQLTP